MLSLSYEKAAIIFGNGINEDGALPQSILSSLETAQKLYMDKSVDYILVCGKWAYSLRYHPPTTEAKAMSTQLQQHGVPRRVIRVEDRSFTTVSNACLAKERYVLPLNIKQVVLVSPEPLTKRAFYNLSYVIGDDASCELIISSFKYPSDKFKKLAAKEESKLKDAKGFLSGQKKGDHRAIYRESTRDLSENYI